MRFSHLLVAFSEEEGNHEEYGDDFSDKSGYVVHGVSLRRGICKVDLGA